MFCSEIATEKPSSRLLKISMPAPSAEVRGPEGERQAQSLDEHRPRENAENEAEDDRFLPAELVTAESADDDQRAGRGEQAERLHQIAVEQAADGDHHQRLEVERRNLRPLDRERAREDDGAEEGEQAAEHGREIRRAHA